MGRNIIFLMDLRSTLPVLETHHGLCKLRVVLDRVALLIADPPAASSRTLSDFFG